MPEKLYYFDEATKQYKIAEKENAMMAIIKLTKQKEDVEQRLQQTEKIIESKLSMFETLLRTELNHTCEEVDDVRKDNIKDNDNLKQELKQFTKSVIEKQNTINNNLNNRIKEHDEKFSNIDTRLDNLENKETKSKAKRWDLVAVAFGGGFLTWLVQFIISIITRISGGQ